MITRRHLTAGLCAGIATGSLGRARAALPRPDDALSRDLARIAAASRGRLGVAVLDTGTGRQMGLRTDERFPMCSTAKTLITAAVLARVDAGRDSLERRIGFTAAELQRYSPVTKDHAGEPGLTLDALCGAAMTLSDNTAANLLLAVLGGPAAVTAFARTLGDPVTRLDRNEPTLNEARPGDPRDTTTPAAMAADLKRLVLGDALSAASRDRLTGWMVACRTGDAKLRAGLPAAWRVGDKTGSNAHGTTSDIAVLWPPGRPPLVVTAYLTGTPLPGQDSNAVFADVGRAVAKAVTSS